jgi:hypothetical protein
VPEQALARVPERALLRLRVPVALLQAPQRGQQPEAWQAR